MGKDSLAGGNLFPHFVGTNSHNMREYFPTIYGTIGTTVYLQPEKRRSIVFNYEKYSEKQWEIPEFWAEMWNKLWEMPVWKSISHSTSIWLTTL